MSTTETQLALIHQRLDQIVELMKSQDEKLDMVSERVHEHSKKFAAAEAVRDEVSVSVARPAPDRRLLVISAAAGGGITFGALLENVLALLF